MHCCCAWLFLMWLLLLCVMHKHSDSRDTSRSPSVHTHTHRRMHTKLFSHAVHLYQQHAKCISAFFRCLRVGAVFGLQPLDQFHVKATSWAVLVSAGSLWQQLLKAGTPSSCCTATPSQASYPNSKSFSYQESPCQHRCNHVIHGQLAEHEHQNLCHALPLA